MPISTIQSNDTSSNIESEAHIDTECSLDDTKSFQSAKNDIGYTEELIVEYWFRTNPPQSMNHISIAVIVHMVIDYVPYHKHLRFDAEFKSELVNLSKDRLTATKNANCEDDNIHVLADIQPVTSGKHAWRLHVEYTFVC